MIPEASNIHTRSGDSSTSVVMRAAERALASASVIGVKTEAISPSSVGAERTATHSTSSSGSAMPYSWSTRPLVRATREAGSCSCGIEPPPGARSIETSDGAPMISSRGNPSIRSIADVHVEDAAVRIPHHDAVLERGRQREGELRHRPAPIR